MTNNLSKCPFCGTYPVCTVTGGTYRVQCDLCLTSGAGYGNERVAVEKWNNRVSTDIEREREVSRRYQNAVKRAITYLSEQIDGDNPTLDQTLSEAIRILEGYP